MRVKAILFLLFLIPLTAGCAHAPRSTAYPSWGSSGEPVAIASPPPHPPYQVDKNSDIALVSQVSPTAPLIVIDAGHGGDDLGTYSPKKQQRYQEKLLTLSTAFMMKTYLQQLGYRTLLTRKEDVFIPLDKRVSIANEAKPALFISIHYNSAPNPEAEGIEVFYYKSEEQKQRSTQSKQLASDILTSMTSVSGAKSRSVKHGDLAVIRGTTMPAVLVEGGFLTNANERAKIKDPTYLKQLAWGMAVGVDNYFKRIAKNVPKEDANNPLSTKRLLSKMGEKRKTIK